MTVLNTSKVYECSWTPNFCAVSPTTFISAFRRWTCCTWAATPSDDIILKVHPLAGANIVQHDGIVLVNNATVIFSCSIYLEHLSSATKPSLTILKAIYVGGCPRTGVFPTVSTAATAQPLSWFIWVVESNRISHPHCSWSPGTIDLEDFTSTVCPVTRYHSCPGTSVSTLTWIWYT